MVLPGLLIEYLVVGSMAFVWIAPLLGFQFLDTISLGKAAIVAPGLYILGLFIDFIAFVLLSRIPTRTCSLKTLARNYVKRKPDVKSIENNVFKDGYGRSSRGRIWLYLNAPDIVTEVQSRSSRDRVARGAVVNLLILAVLSKIYPVEFVQVSQIPVLVWILLILFSLGVWFFLETNSYGFELRAGEMIQEVMQSDKENN